MRDPLKAVQDRETRRRAMLDTGAIRLAPERRIGRWDHQCPECRRLIKWCLTYCCLCSWQEGRNEQWLQN